MILIVARDLHLASQIQDGLRDLGQDAEVVTDIDATNMRAVRSAVADRRPKAVLHMAFLDDAAACEAQPDRAFLHNAESVINLAAATLEFAAIPMILSPAQVLAGAPHRGENDAPLATSTWTESRIRGEVFLRRAAPRGLVLRAGPLLSVGLLSESDRLASGLTVGAARVQPVLAPWLGKVLHAALASQLHGVLHVPSAGPARPENEVWCDIAGRLGRPAHTVRVEGAAGSGNAVLRCERLAELVGLGEPPAWTEALGWQGPAEVPEAMPAPGELRPPASGPIEAPAVAASAALNGVEADDADGEAPDHPDDARDEEGREDGPARLQQLTLEPPVWAWVLRPGDAARWTTPAPLTFQVVLGKAFIEAGDEDLALKADKRLQLDTGIELRVTVPETTVLVIVGGRRN